MEFEFDAGASLRFVPVRFAAVRFAPDDRAALVRLPPDVRFVPEARLPPELRFVPEVRFALDVRFVPEALFAAEVRFVPDVRFAPELRLVPEARFALAERVGLDDRAAAVRVRLVEEDLLDEDLRFVARAAVVLRRPLPSAAS